MIILLRLSFRRSETLPFGIPRFLVVGSPDWWAQVESSHSPEKLLIRCIRPSEPSSFPLSPRCFRSLVGSSGVEPPTSCLSGMRSNLLSYEPIPFRTGLLVRPLRPHRGGDEGIRTLDPLLAGQVLSQLSYTPIKMSASVFSMNFTACAVLDH